MKASAVLFVVLMIAALALSACGQAATPAPAAMMDKPTEAAMMDKPTEAAMMDKPTEAAMMDKPTEAAMMDKPTETAMMDKPTEAAMMDKPTEAAMMDKPTADLPAWYSAELINVNNSQPFTVADFHGKVVLIETLAVWCSNCMKQQRQVMALHDALGEREDFVSVGLDIDLNESADQLLTHTSTNGFDWVYAVATPDVARAISDLYGVNFLNPPSTPMLIIDRAGEAHPLPFGIKSAADLQTALEPFLADTEN